MITKMTLIIIIIVKGEINRILILRFLHLSLKDRIHLLETRLTGMYDLCSKDVCTHGVLGGGTSSDDLGVSADPAWSAFSVARRELALRTPPPTLHTHTHTTHTHTHARTHARTHAHSEFNN